MPLTQQQIDYRASLPVHPEQHRTGAVVLEPDYRDYPAFLHPGIWARAAAGNLTPTNLLKFIQEPRYDQGQEGSCFKAGTRVRMADGSERPIEAVRLLDSVLTAEGNCARVLRTMVREHTGPLVNLRLWGHAHLETTPEHPVLTRRGYQKARALQPGDWVALPRYLPETQLSIRPSDHVSEADQRRTTREGRFRFSGRERVTHERSVSRLPDEIPLTPAFGRIIGLFLAEGHTTSNRVGWTFGPHEMKTLAQELTILLRETLSVDAYVQRCPRNVNVNLFGKHWRVLFESLCATGAGKKRLHPGLCAGPREFLAAVFDGWMDGDGHRDAQGRCTGVTVSHDLALGMYDIAQAIGLHPNIRVSHPKVSHGVKTRRDRWDIRYSTMGSPRCEQTESHVWRKVRAIAVTESAPVFVYNLHVEGDNSYVAEGIGVHNCVPFSICGNCTLAHSMADGSWPQYAGHQLYAEAGGVANSGADARTTLNICVNQGTPLLAFGREKVVRSYVFVDTTPGVARPQIKAALASGLSVLIACLLPIPFGWNSGTALSQGYHEWEAVGWMVDSQGVEWYYVLNSWNDSWPGDAPAGIPRGVGRIRCDVVESPGNQGYFYAIVPTDLTITPPPPPLLAVSSYVPNPVAAALEFTVQGAGFTPDAQLVFMGARLATRYLSSTALMAAAPAALGTVVGPVSVTQGSGSAMGPPLTVLGGSGPPPPLQRGATISGKALGPQDTSLWPAVSQVMTIWPGVTFSAESILFDNAPPPPPPPPPPGQLTVDIAHGPHHILAATVKDATGAYVDATCQASVGGTNLGTRLTHPAGGSAIPAVWATIGLAPGSAVTVTATTADNRTGTGVGTTS